MALPRPLTLITGPFCFWLALYAWGSVLIFAPSAQAGQVALEMTAHTRAVEGRAEILMQVANRGDDAAINLQVAPMAPWTGAPSPLADMLAPGQGIELSLAVDLPPGLPGRRALPLRLDFQDLNQFPFSALAYGYCVQGTDRASPLLVQAQPLEMDYQGTLEVKLVNTEERPIRLEWRVLAPRELAVDSTPRQLELAARSGHDISLEVKSVTAQLQADYSLLIWTGYDLDGARLEKIVEARVRLVREENYFHRTLVWWLAAAGLLLAWVVLVQVRRRKRP